jgi:hypothetical protein
MIVTSVTLSKRKPAANMRILEVTGKGVERKRLVRFRLRAYPHPCPLSLPGEGNGNPIP